MGDVVSFGSKWLGMVGSGWNWEWVDLVRVGSDHGGLQLEERRK